MESPPKNDFARGNLWPSLVLIFLVVAVFSLCLRNGFVIVDDPSYVTGNALVQKGITWPGVMYAFTDKVVDNWHPLTTLSLMLDCQLFGLKAWGHHLMGVIYHALNTVLVFLVLRRMTGAGGRSFLVALLFGLHPVHVESVAWVAERKDVLSTAFALLTLLAYGKFVAGRRQADYWLALVFFAGGLLSKSMVVTLPCVLLLLDFWPLNRWKKDAVRGLLLEKVPFLLLSAGTCLMALHTQKDAIVSLTNFPWQLRVENCCLSYVRYLGKIFWPMDLCLPYPPPDAWPLARFILCAVLLAGITAVAVGGLRRRPYLFMGWFWFLGILVPVIGLVQVGDQSMADRYLYLPAVGIFIAVVWLLGEVAESFQQEKTVFRLAAPGLAVACAILTIRQIQYWHDAETLLHHTLAVTQNNGAAHLLLGDELRTQGRYEEAIAEFKEGIRLDPGAASIYRELGLDLLAVGKNAEAIQAFATAFQLSPGAESGNNLGMALNDGGHYTEAIQVFQKTLETNPGVEELHFNLGNALAHSGKLPEAIAEFKMALALKPDDIGAHNNLGAMLFQARQWDGAIAEFQAVLALDPSNVEAQKNLAAILRMKNRAP